MPDLLNGFREGPCDGHHLAHRLHLRPQGALHRGKLVDIPARNLAQWAPPPGPQIEIQWLVMAGHPVLVLRILSSMGDLQDPKMELLYHISGHILGGYSLTGTM